MAAEEQDAVAIALGTLSDLAGAMAGRVRPLNPRVAEFLVQQSRTVQALASPPKVTGTNPQDGAGGINVGEVVSVTFANPVDPTTVTVDTVFVMADSGGPHLSAVLSLHNDARTVSLRTENELSPDVLYRITVAADVSNQAGFRLGEDVTATFRTAHA